MTLTAPPAPASAAPSAPAPAATTTPVGGSLQKAKLVLLEPPNPPSKPPSMASMVSKARAGGVGEVEFTFNPKEYTHAKSANWKRDPKPGAKSAGMPEFTGTGPGTLTLECFLDGTADAHPTVGATIETLLSTVKPLTSSVSQKKPTPPWVAFLWGGAEPFIGIMKTVSAKITMFRPEGDPLRAVVSLTLEEMPTEAPRQNPTSGGPDTRRQHLVVDGDALPLVATREYGDPNAWRAIAEANGIDDPLRLAVGTRLLLPTTSGSTTRPGAT